VHREQAIHGADRRQIHAAAEQRCEDLRGRLVGEFRTDLSRHVGT
jgi:hypothetical protein